MSKKPTAPSRQPRSAGREPAAGLRNAVPGLLFLAGLLGFGLILHYAGLAQRTLPVAELPY
jgi:hypothetical protein